MEQQHQLPPGLLFRSFLIVAGGYLLSIVVMAIIFGGIASVYFPEIFDEKLGDEFSADPARFLTGIPFWWLLGSNFVVSLLLGYIVAWLAPFGQFPHCVFLAVLVFVGNLQQAMDVPQDSKWIYLSFMLLFPLAILIGGHLSVTWQHRRLQQDEQEPD